MSWAQWIRDVEVEPSLYAADFAHLGEQIDMLLRAGVRTALALVPALADDLAVADDDGADDGIRMCCAAPSLGQLERPFDTHASSCTKRL